MEAAKVNIIHFPRYFLLQLLASRNISLMQFSQKEKTNESNEIRPRCWLSPCGTQNICLEQLEQCTSLLCFVMYVCVVVIVGWLLAASLKNNSRVVTWCHRERSEKTKFAWCCKPRFERPSVWRRWFSGDEGLKKSRICWLVCFAPGSLVRSLAQTKEGAFEMAVNELIYLVSSFCCFSTKDPSSTQN